MSVYKYKFVCVQYQRYYNSIHCAKPLSCVPHLSVNTKESPAPTDRILRNIYYCWNVKAIFFCENTLERERENHILISMRVCVRSCECASQCYRGMWKKVFQELWSPAVTHTHTYRLMCTEPVGPTMLLRTAYEERRDQPKVIHIIFRDHSVREKTSKLGLFWRLKCGLLYWQKLIARL